MVRVDPYVMPSANSDREARRGNNSVLRNDAILLGQVCQIKCHPFALHLLGFLSDNRLPFHHGPIRAICSCAE